VWLPTVNVEGHEPPREKVVVLEAEPVGTRDDG